MSICEALELIVQPAVIRYQIQMWCGLCIMVQVYHWPMVIA